VAQAKADRARADADRHGDGYEVRPAAIERCFAGGVTDTDQVPRRANHAGLGVLVAIAIASCGESRLDSASTCAEYLEASDEARATYIARALGVQDGGPDDSGLAGVALQVRQDCARRRQARLDAVSRSVLRRLDAGVGR
jgi:hypothetical protein